MEIKIDKVSYKEIFKNLSLTIKDNQITGIIGPSGSGKSTLLKLIMKLDDYNGNINVNLEESIGIVLQKPSDNFFLKKVKEEFNTLSTKTGNKEKRMIDSLKMVGLDKGYLNRDIADLSFGEQKKLSIALVLYFNPKTILLDEPVLGLDTQTKNEIIKLLKMIKNRYHKTIIITSTDTEMIHFLCDYIYVLNKGKVVLEGDKYHVFQNLNKLDINIPKIINFSLMVKELKNQKIGFRDDINDLIKDIYRYASK